MAVHFDELICLKQFTWLYNVKVKYDLLSRENHRNGMQLPLQNLWSIHVVQIWHIFTESAFPSVQTR